MQNAGMKRLLTIFSNKRIIPFYAGITAFLFSVFSIAISNVSGFSTIWLSNAILLVFMLRNDSRQAYAILLMGALGNFLGGYYANTSLLLSVLFSLINFIELLPALYLVRRRYAGDITLNQFDPVFFTLLYSIVGGCVIAGILGGITLSVFGHFTFYQIAASWFIADFFAMVVILPLGLNLNQSELKKLQSGDYMLELILIVLLCISIIFVYHLHETIRYVVIMMPLLLAAFRFQVLGTAIANLATVIALVLLSLIGDQLYLNDMDLINNSFFLVITTLIPPLLIAILLNQKNIYAYQVEQNEQRWKYALEGGGHDVWDWDVASGEIYISNTWKKMLGYEEDEIKNSLKEWSDRIHPDDKDAVLKIVNNHLEGITEEYSSEHRVRCKNNEYIWILDRGKVIARDKNGQPLRVIGTHTNIDSIKKTEAHEHLLTDELSREKEQLRVTLQSIGDAVIVVDSAGKIVFINTQAMRLTACTEENAFGKYFNEICEMRSIESNIIVESPIADSLKGKVVLYQDEEVVLLNSKGERFYIKISAAPINDASGNVNGAVMAMHDVTIDRHLKIELQHFATHDPLTGLTNRREFEKELKQFIEDDVYSDSHNALLYLDLDHFKIVNDSAGHAAGDELLKQICMHMQAALRDTDPLARIGGDEFAAILPDCNEKNAIRVAEKIIDSIKSYRFNWDERIYEIGLSVGIVIFKSQTDAVEELMRKADIACYHAKNNGGNISSVYNIDYDEYKRDHGEIYFLSSIKESIRKNRLVLYAHEIRPVHYSSTQYPHYEILLRWIDDNGNIMLPSNFISIAERKNQMVLIDQWVLNQVLMEYGPRISSIPGLSISINLSAQSINLQSFLDHVQMLIQKTRIPKSNLGFELTETAVINHLLTARDFFNYLKQEGCFITLDDFGAGLSSFNYLKHFPAKFVKIDGNFIRHLVDSPIDQAIVESINELVHRLHGYTIAEYVESPEVMKIVNAIGIDYMQGEYVSHEKPLDELLIELESNTEV